MNRPEDVRLAFFISSYGPGAQLRRLVTALRQSDPTAHIVIHHDVGGAPLTPGLFDDDVDVHVLYGTEPIVWGDLTLETARWRVFRWILDNLDIDWVMLLSEQDYPIAPMDALRRRIVEAESDALVYGRRVMDMPDAAMKAEGVKRYHHRYASLPSSGIERSLPAPLRALTFRGRRGLFAAVNRLQTGIHVYMADARLGLPSRVGVRLPGEPLGRDFPIWWNNCWFAMSSHAMRRVVDYVDAHPAFVRHFERTVIPVESATATILFNDPDLTVSNTDLHYIRWSDPTSGRPDVFGIDDVDELASSGHVFARKFDPRDTAVLDALDRVVLQSNRETH